MSSHPRRYKSEHQLCLHHLHVPIHPRPRNLPLLQNTPIALIPPPIILRLLPHSSAEHRLINGVHQKCPSGVLFACESLDRVESEEGLWGVRDTFVGERKQLGFGQ